MNASLPAGYRLLERAPDVESYRRLRAESGLTPKSVEQATAALKGHWAAYVVVHDASDEDVAMGRVLGDGGWYFHIVDMAVLPGHQRQGLGAVVLEALLAKIDREAPPDPYVTLMADPPGRGLYAKYGFIDASARSLGMTRRSG